MIVDAKTDCEFLKLIISQMEETGMRGVQASICRKAGFASRSYFSEVLSGKKGLSRDSMLRLKSALKLTGVVGKLFELLAIQSNPGIDPRMDQKQIGQKISNLRAEIKRANDLNHKEIKPDLNRPELFQVYAALGSIDSGSNLEQICYRTGLSKSTVKRALQLMMDQGFVEGKEDRYFAVTSKADNLSSTDHEAVSELIKKVCFSLQRNRSVIAKDKANLNVYSAFSIRREQMYKFKQTLQKAVFDVLDEFQDDDGDCVEQIFLSAFRAPVDFKEI